MSKVIMFILGFIFVISISAHGQEKCTISGEIIFKEEKGQLFVWLKTKEEYEKKILPIQPSRSLLIKPSQLGLVLVRQTQNQGID